jgi:hypothetical protein
MHFERVAWTKKQVHGSPSATRSVIGPAWYQDLPVYDNAKNRYKGNHLTKKRSTIFTGGRPLKQYQNQKFRIK